MPSYILVGNSSIVQVLGPQVSAEMEAVTIQTVPTGIVATTLVSREAFDSGTAAPDLTSFGDAIEAIVASGKVSGGSGTSNLSASRLQTYYVTFEVVYNPPGAPTGTVTADVDVPASLLTTAQGTGTTTPLQEAQALVDATYNNLVAMSGNAPPASAPPGVSPSPAPPPRAE